MQNGGWGRILGLVALALVSGCSGDGWPEAVQITFRDSCLRNGRAAAAPTTPDEAVVAYCDCLLHDLQAVMTHHELGQKEALAVSRAKQENISVGEAFGADPVIMAATEHCGAARKD